MGPTPVTATPRPRRSPARRRTTTAAVLVAALSLALAACGSDDQTSASASDGEASYGEISIQYSWIKNEEFAGEFYAYDNGYYDEAGFSEVIGISGPDTGVAKLLSGEVQVALSDAASIGAAIAEQDAPLKIIGATFQKNPFTILSLKDGGDIATPEDLIGKKIGVQDSNASVFAAILNANGIDPADGRGRAGRLRPDAADERRRRRLHGLPHQRGDHRARWPATRSPTFRTPRTACPTSPRPTRSPTSTSRRTPTCSRRSSIAEIKGWTDVFKESTDDTVDADHQVLRQGRLGERRGSREQSSVRSTRRRPASASKRRRS